MYLLVLYVYLQAFELNKYCISLRSRLPLGNYRDIPPILSRCKLCHASLLL